MKDDCDGGGRGVGYGKGCRVWERGVGYGKGV